MDLPVSRRLLFITAIIMLQTSAYAQNPIKIPLGSSLIANSTNSTWKSHSGVFGFGFRKVTGGYLLAIVFDKIPERTIVWSANDGRLFKEGSTVQLHADGIEVHDSEGQSVRAVNVSGSGVAYGTMLDNGNFVLARKNSTATPMWQSFDVPTNTLLPEQVLNQDGSLFSSFSETNYSRGRFKFIMQTDGNVVLYILNYPRADPMSPYWSSQTYQSDGHQVIFNQSGYINLIDKNGSVVTNISQNEVSTTLYYQRLTLDYDGVLTHYVYPKSTDSTGGRPMAWSINYVLPTTNICLSFGGIRRGGPCGFNSVCSLTGPRVNCTCPKEYSQVDPADRMSGCKPDFVQQRCGGNSSTESDDFDLFDMLSTDWVNSEYDYYESVSEDWCRQSCLDDCVCHAVVFSGSKCWKMGFPLRNGRIDNSGKGGKSMVKYRKG